MGREFKTHRVFNGERFRWYEGAGTKARANEIATKLRDRGHKVRVVKASAGESGYFIYYKQVFTEELSRPQQDGKGEGVANTGAFGWVGAQEVCVQVKTEGEQVISSSMTTGW